MLNKSAGAVTHEEGRLTVEWAVGTGRQCSTVPLTAAMHVLVHRSLYGINQVILSATFCSGITNPSLQMRFLGFSGVQVGTIARTLRIPRAHLLHISPPPPTSQPISVLEAFINAAPWRSNTANTPAQTVSKTNNTVMLIFKSNSSGLQESLYHYLSEEGE